MRFSNWSPISQGRIVSLGGCDTGVISTWHVKCVPRDTWHVSREGYVLPHWLSLSWQGWIISTHGYIESFHWHSLNKGSDRGKVSQHWEISLYFSMLYIFLVIAGGGHGVILAHCQGLINGKCHPSSCQNILNWYKCRGWGHHTHLLPIIIIYFHRNKWTKNASICFLETMLSEVE